MGVRNKSEQIVTAALGDTPGGASRARQNDDLPTEVEMRGEARKLRQFTYLGPACTSNTWLGYCVGPSGGTGTVMAGLSVPPSISKTLPVTHDDASLTR